MVGNGSYRIVYPHFLLKPLFLLSVLVMLAVEISEAAGYHVPYFHWYANDLVAMPVILYLAEYMERIISKAYEVYSVHKIIAACMMVSMAFEVLLPLLLSRYTADLIDVLMYACGAFVYAKFK